MALSLVGLAANAWCCRRWVLMRRRLEGEFEHYRAQRRLFEHAIGVLEPKPD